jgi:hypothetical protein
LKKTVQYSLIIFLAFCSLSFQQQSNYDTNAKVKAVFLYNFTKYFKWPEKMRSGNFVIQIIGTNTALNVELNKMSSTKQVGNQKLEIKNSNSIDGEAPQIVFILNDFSEMLKDVSGKLKGKGSLIVTEKPGLAKAGSAINFVVADNKQRFEYSKNNAKKAGLITGEGLNSLAIAVD